MATRVKRRKELTGECDIGSGRIHCTVRQCSFTMLSLMRARRPRTQAALGRARPAHPVVTYAGETSAHPGGAWASETRAPGCHLCGRDARAPRRRLGGRDARGPMCKRPARRFPRRPRALRAGADDRALSNMGGTACRAPLIRHRNDDMLRSGRNAPSCSPHSRGFGEDLSLSESLPSESMLARLPDSHCDRIACLYPGTGYDEH